MVEAGITRGALRAVETPPSPSATTAADEAVRGAVRDPSSLRRRLSAEVHGAAAVVGVAVVGEEKGGKSPCLAVLASLHHAYAPFIIVPAVVDSSSSSSSSSATNAAERVTARRRRRERETITSLVIAHRVLRKTNPI